MLKSIASPPILSPARGSARRDAELVEGFTQTEALVLLDAECQTLGETWEQKFLQARDHNNDLEIDL